MRQNPRPPESGEIQIVTLIGADMFLAWAPAETIEDLMDAFERRAGLTESARSDREAQGVMRIRIAEALRSHPREKAEGSWQEVLASGCLWLALRHWSSAEQMGKGLKEQIERSGSAIITASIPDRPPEGMMADTAWAFMIGSNIHDGREELARTPGGEVRIVGGNLAN